MTESNSKMGELKGKLRTVSSNSLKKLNRTACHPPICYSKKNLHTHSLITDQSINQSIQKVLTRRRCQQCTNNNSS